MQPNEQEHNQYGADILIGLVLVATFGPLGAALGMVLAFCRHSPVVVGGLLDIASAVRGGDTPLLTGTTARAMLPALERLLPAPTEQAGEAPETTQRAAQQATGATKDTPAVATRQLAMIDLTTLAKCSTILLVGSRGSGKSTLLRALLTARKQHATVAVYDPHAAPDDWPMATMVHNSEASISSGLASAYKRLQSRKDERRKGIRTEGWSRLTLAADEWGSIVGSVELPKEINRTPGEVSTELMKEGRKFGIGFVAGAHGFTNKSLGCTGDQEAFLQSFDWIIQLGGFTRKLLEKQYADLFAEIPMGTNEEGGTFPLIVACVSPTTGEMRLLDMRGLETVNTTQRRIAPALPWSQEQKQPDQALLAGLITGNEEPTTLPPDSNEVTHELPSVQAELPVTNVVVTPLETTYIAAALVGNEKPSDIAKRLPGYSPRRYKEFKAKVEYVKAMLDTYPTNEETPEPSNDESDEPPSWFDKAFE